MGSELNDWIRSALGNICEINMGQSPPSSTYNSDGIGLPFYQGIRDFGRKYPKPSIFCSRPHKIAERGDVLLSVRAPIGEVNIASEKCCIGRGVAALRLKKGSNEFLFQLMRYIKPHWKKMFEEKGTVFGCVTKEDIRSFIVTIPENPSERQKIAEILGSLDDKIELNYEMNKTLEAMAQTIFNSWFVDFEPFKDELVYNEELDKEMPENWQVKPFSEIIHVNPSRRLTRDTLAKKASMPDLKPWQSWIESWSYEEYKAGPTFQNGDILFARITPSLEHGKTALVSFLDDGEVAFGTTEFIIFAPKIIRSSLYIFCLARNGYVRKRAIGEMTGSSGRQRVPNDCFDHLLISVPPQHVVKEFDDIVSPMFEVISTNAKENRILKKIRDALLPKLLSGEMRVKIEKKIKKSGRIKKEKTKIQKSLLERCKHAR